MNLMESISFNAGKKVKSDKEQFMDILKEDINVFGVDEALRLYNTLFLLDKEASKYLKESVDDYLVEVSLRDYDGGGENDAEARLRKLSDRGTNPLYKKPSIEQKDIPYTRTGRGQGENHIRTGRGQSELSNPSLGTADVGFSKSGASQEASNFALSQKAAAEANSKSFDLESIGAEKQAAFKEAIRSKASTPAIMEIKEKLSPEQSSALNKAISGGNFTEASKIAKEAGIDLGPMASPNAATAGVKGVAGAVAPDAPKLTGLAGVWQRIKGFFQNGFAGISKAFQTGNFQSLLGIPMVQVAIAVGSWTLVWKMIKKISSLKKNKQGTK